MSVYLADFGPQLSENYIGFTLTVAAGDGNRPTIAGLSSGVDVNANRLLLGIRSWSGDPPTVNFVSNAATNLLYNTTYRVVMQYFPGTAQNYWIGEPGTLSESSLYASTGAGGGSRDSFFFRDSGVFEIAFDDLVVATTFAEAAIPEPSAIGLVLLGGAGLVAWRRRRRPKETVPLSPADPLPGSGS